MIKLFNRIREHRAIINYIRYLPALLINRYGRHSYYTPAQVIKTIEACGLSRYAIQHALVCFCEKADVLNYYRANNQVIEYDSIYQNLVAKYLNGNSSVSIMKYTSVRVKTQDPLSKSDGVSSSGPLL